MKKIIECVPNISEGRDADKIRQISEVVETVSGVKLLDVDPGAATNRTVITFVGEPEAVVEAAFLLIKKASELIDMSKHHGEHPRFGATDVCPLVPVSGISMEAAADYARKLANRVGRELHIPVYLYENAAADEKRKNLANCRAGEYEGLKEKLSDPAWKPDFGPSAFNDNIRKTGAMAIGARDFLVAYNINLNSTSTRHANAIAFDIREAGRIIKKEDGKQVRIPGKLKCVKGIGWYIEEYGIAQISYNLTNINITSVHICFEESCKAANERGIRVTGSELVGLIPMKAMIDAADYFLRKQKRSMGISQKEKIMMAVKSLGLDDLKPFEPEKKIIELMMETGKKKILIDQSLAAFCDNTASEKPAPGGGSVAAYLGALGAALGTMVANLSAHKREWEHRWKEFSGWAEKGQNYKDELLRLVDEDTEAFNSIMAAFKLPAGNDDLKKARASAIEEATKRAIEVPLKVMRAALDSMEVIKVMAKKGIDASASDTGVGALCARSAVTGAFLNVKINAAGLKDKAAAASFIATGKDMNKKAIKSEKYILKIVEKKLSS